MPDIMIAQLWIINASFFLLNLLFLGLNIWRAANNNLEAIKREEDLPSEIALHLALHPGEMARLLAQKFPNSIINVQWTFNGVTRYGAIPKPQNVDVNTLSPIPPFPPDSAT